MLVQVAYSSLNYKDGLAVTGKGKVVRGDYPFVPGIDLVGTVETSESEDYAPGDRGDRDGVGDRRGPLGRLRAEGTGAL